MDYQITFMPQKLNISAAEGQNLLDVLRQAGIAPDAPCGGNGSCGKCTVIIDGKPVKACKTPVDRDMTVSLPQTGVQKILLSHEAIQNRFAANGQGYALAFDIGTTTVAGYLLDRSTGKVLAAESILNPQHTYGADVISRIRHALGGQMESLTQSIRHCVHNLILCLCQKANISASAIHMIGIVGNPAMQQLFLGISPQNLAQLPFAAVLTQAKEENASHYLPICPNARLLTVPDISGFVGADTVAAVLATALAEQEQYTLMVDIGTNAEMVLGNKHRMVACSAAAGPALEGAGISIGMRGQAGAIDHVQLTGGKIQCSVIGGGEPKGICGSGLIDAMAVGLQIGVINSRGRITSESRRFYLTDALYLTQEDIRQVQLAKGAIAAGVEMLAAHLGIETKDIAQVYLAGAFGTYMNTDSACAMGLLPSILRQKILPVGNAAGGGAQILACNSHALGYTAQLVKKIEFLELASLPDFQRSFAKNMRF